MKAAQKAVGIDIGGSKIAVAAVAEDGSIEGSVTLATEAGAGFSCAIERIARAIETVIVGAGWQEAEICGIGLGCAGPVDPFRGIIHNPYTLPGWDGCDIVQPLHERFNTPVFLENDADTAALGEHMVGAGRGRNPLVMLTFGTGVGGALLRNGRIQRGVNGEHPEQGHMLVNTDGPECYCGARGCLEALASGSAIAAAGRACGLADAQAVFAEARAGGAKAQAILDRATNAVAMAAWNLCHTFLPQRLILGGGIMERHYALFEPVINQRLRTATQFSRDAVDIAQAALGNNAGVVGAADLAFAQSQPDAPGSRPALEPLTTQIVH